MENTDSQQETEFEISADVQSLIRDKEADFNWQQRRHSDWTENYTLYRDKVQINRLTQRQSVNIPMMKWAVRTLLKDVDDMPDLEFDNLDNDQQKQIDFNAFWQDTVENNKLEIKDIVDKRQVFLYGRSFKKLNIVDGKPYIEILDPQDVLIDRYVDPADLDTARHIFHTHIFRSFDEIEKNTHYNQDEVKKLKAFFATREGLVKAEDNQRSLNEKNDRMRAMGVPDVDNPILGTTIVELTEAYRKENGEIWLYVLAENMVTLWKERQEVVIGTTKDHYWKNHYLISSWADDVERTDVWSDAVADIIRTPNHVINTWFSQLVENRTFRNLNMHYYDATHEGFVPQTFEPVAWGWYPLPGKPSDVLQVVETPDLSDTKEDMSFLIEIMERATGATATQQGVPNEKSITLGEVELILGEAKERVQAMAKFYISSWKDLGTKFAKLVEAAPDKLDEIEVYRKGYRGNMFSKKIKPKNWLSKKGYGVRVSSKKEKALQETERLQKLNAAKSTMPANVPLAKIYKKKVLEFAGLTPDESREVMDYEDQLANAPMNPMLGGQPTDAVMPATPAPPVMA